MNALKDATVLVVDDEPDLCEMLAFEFRLQGSRVLSASDGTDAFRLIETERVDAVVTDIQMAHGSGIQLLDRIRSRDTHEPLVVFITAYDTALSPMDAYDRGAEGYFGKPFPLKDLIDCVQRILTIPSARWASPPGDAAEVHIARRWQSLTAARQQRLIDMGRGGFAISMDSGASGYPLDPGRRLSFLIKFEEGPVSAIEGAGTVRWAVESRNSNMCCGVEFDYVSPACRDQLIGWISGNSCRSFIPRLIG